MNKQKKYSRRVKTPRRQKKPFSLLNIVNIILSIILAFSILITIFALRENSDDFYDSDSSLYYKLSEEYYSDLDARYYDSVVGNEDNPKAKKLSQYYAVGRYFEKAFFANAYETAGMTEKAASMRSQMDELETQMGEFSAEQEKIRKIFQ